MRELWVYVSNILCYAILELTPDKREKFNAKSLPELVKEIKRSISNNPEAKKDLICVHFHPPCVAVIYRKTIEAFSFNTLSKEEIETFFKEFNKTK